MAYTALALTNLGRRIEHARYNSVVLPAPVSPDMIREWLCEARTLARTGGHRTPGNELFVVWGMLLGNLMQMVKDKAKPEDSEHLAQFLQVASRLTPDELLHVKSTFRAVDDPTEHDSTPRLPVYDSLSFVTSNLSSSAGQVMLVQALEENDWEPSPLLVLLTHALDAQRAYASSPRRGGIAKKNLAETAFGELLLALQKTWLVSDWRPSQMSNSERTVYRYLWDMYPYVADWQYNSENQAEMHACILAATTAEFPEHGLQVLAFIRENNRIAEVILEAILPIRFELLDSKKSIDAVAGLFEFNARGAPGSVVGLFPEMFGEYHPELNGLLQMHYALYPLTPDGTPAVMELDYLVGAWDAICKNKLPESPASEHEVLGRL